MCAHTEANAEVKYQAPPESLFNPLVQSSASIPPPPPSPLATAIESRKTYASDRSDSHCEVRVLAVQFVRFQAVSRVSSSVGDCVAVVLS